MNTNTNNSYNTEEEKKFYKNIEDICLFAAKFPEFELMPFCQRLLIHLTEVEQSRILKKLASAKHVIYVSSEPSKEDNIMNKTIKSSLGVNNTTPTPNVAPMHYPYSTPISQHYNYCAADADMQCRYYTTTENMPKIVSYDNFTRNADEIIRKVSNFINYFTQFITDNFTHGFDIEKAKDSISNSIQDQRDVVRSLNSLIRNVCIASNLAANASTVPMLTANDVYHIEAINHSPVRSNSYIAIINADKLKKISKVFPKMDGIPFIFNPIGNMIIIVPSDISIENLEVRTTLASKNETAEIKEKYYNYDSVIKILKGYIYIMANVIGSAINYPLGYQTNILINSTRSDILIMAMATPFIIKSLRSIGIDMSGDELRDLFPYRAAESYIVELYIIDKIRTLFDSTDGTDKDAFEIALRLVNDGLLFRYIAAGTEYAKSVAESASLEGDDYSDSEEDSVTDESDNQNQDETESYDNPGGTTTE